MDNIKNILFDFGGVIVGLNKQNAVNRFKEIGVDKIDDYLGEFRQEGIFLALEEGTISREEFYTELRTLAGKNTSTEDIDSAWMSFLLDITEYKYQMLKDLRKKYNVYLLSNTNPIVMDWALSSEFSPSGENIRDFFDKCYLSYEIGCAKPDKKIFEFVIQDSGLNPAETLFLDDGPSNIKAAEDLGFKGYLANQTEDLRKVFSL